MKELPGSLGEPRARKGGFKTLVVCACVSALVMTAYSQEGPSGALHALRSGVQTLAEPFQTVGSAIEQPFDAVLRAFEDANADTETLTELRNRNAQLVAQLSELQVYKQENESLKAMLGLSTSLGTTGLAAQVISASQDGWTDTVVIDRGSDDGVALDMPVTDGSCLVGQVCAVSASSATVRLVSDPSFSASVAIGQSGATGIVSVSADSTVRVEYVSSSAQVSVGDTVATSGLSDVYPKGLVVGTVASVSAQASSMYYDIVVTPLYSVANASQVYVITSFNESAADGSEQTAQEAQGGEQ